MTTSGTRRAHGPVRPARHAPAGPGAGALLREWRQRRRLSQLELASKAEVSTRHLSFVETGRSVPSRELLLHLAEQLDLPLRDRNRLLVAGGYAPVYGEDALASPRLAAVAEAVRHTLAGHEPYPAAVVDRWWDLVDATSGVALLTEGVAPELLEPPANVLRVSLHPDGMAPRILNLPQWRDHVLGRLLRQVEATGDLMLAELYDELRAYPVPGSARLDHAQPDDLVVPLRLRHGDGELRFVSTVTTFGTPLDVTVAEIVIESFFPADAATAALLRRG